MPIFKVNTILKGLPTEVRVKEPLNWNCHEFKIAFFNAYVRDSLCIKLEDGRWHPTRHKNLSNDKQVPRKEATACSLEDLEIEAIGLEIAKYWKKKLEVNLRLYSDIS